MSSAKYTLIVEMVMMMAVARRRSIRMALKKPSNVPTVRPTNKTNGGGKFSRVAAYAAVYCATDAVAAKDISMPPVTSTTNRPMARIAVTE